MGDVYILKDTLHSGNVSKINNFTLEWIKWYRFAKIAPKAYKFGPNDIVIINLNSSISPTDGYEIHPRCKRICIVHKMNRANLEQLKNADYIIYMNDVMKQIAEIGGVTKRHSVCPRYPLYDFFGTEFNKDDIMHIGGWFFDDRIDGLKEHLIEVDTRLPKSIQFQYHYLWGAVESRKEKIYTFLNQFKDEGLFNERPNMFPLTELSYLIGLFNTRVSKYGFIHRNSPSIEKVFDLINDKDESLLDYDISESSMLAMYQSSNTEVICNDNIDCLPYFKPTEYFTFKMFAGIIDNAVKKVS